MAARPILEIGNPLLRAPSRAVSSEELDSARIQGLIDDMIETMHGVGGAGLAAPQVGEPVRVAVIEVGAECMYRYKPDIPLTVLINPSVRPLTARTFDNYEGCLSVPGLMGRVPRFGRVLVEGLERDGRPFCREIAGISAGTFQHELDHLDGILFVDRVLDPRSLCTWQEFQRHHMEPFARSVEEIEALWNPR
jgi:peptide deformylase